MSGGAFVARWQRHGAPEHGNAYPFLEGNEWIALSLN
jgi:hypothetical protein